LKLEDMDEDFFNYDFAADLMEDATQVPQSPYVSLRDLGEMDPENREDREFLVKGAVIDTVPPFLFNSGKFSLKVKIDDGTDSVVVELGDQLIASLVGISCSTFRENLKSEEGKMVNAKALKRMETALVDLEGVMSVSFPSNSATPMVSQIVPPTEQQAWDLYRHLARIPDLS
jgi:hypothetical protein